MKTKIFTVLSATLFLLTGCTSYDDSELKDRVTRLETEVTSLAAQIAQINTSITGLQTLVGAMSAGDYITSISEIKEGDKVIGYTIEFAKAEPITIYNGQDGSTPVIGVTKGEDGIYYWTVNGELLYDTDDKPVPATGATPSIRINDGKWQISLDNGKTWNDITVTGTSGPLFQSVEVSDDFVTFTLSDGTVFKIAKLNDFALSFSQSEYFFDPAAECIVSYRIKGGDSGTKVAAFPQGGINAQLKPLTDTTGTISVSFRDETSASGYLIVLASNGRGQKDYELLSFEGLVFNVTALDIAFEAAGGTQTVEVSSNVEYRIVLSSGASEWLAVTQEESGFSSRISVTASENKFKRVNTATISFEDQYGNVIRTISVAQAAAEYTAGGGLEDIPVNPAFAR